MSLGSVIRAQRAALEKARDAIRAIPEATHLGSECWDALELAEEAIVEALKLSGEKRPKPALVRLVRVGDSWRVLVACRGGGSSRFLAGPELPGRRVLRFYVRQLAEKVTP